MKEIEYVYDMRGQISPITDIDLPDIYPLNTIRFDDEHRYNVPVHSIKLGHVLYAQDFDSLKCYKIQLVHKYSGTHFFKWLEGPKKGKTECVSKTSLFFTSMIFPIRIVVPEGITLKCYCPLTEIVHDYDGETVTKRRKLTGI